MNNNDQAPPEDGLSPASDNPKEQTPEQIVSNAFSAAKSFYQGKTYKNQRKYHWWNRASWVVFGIGALLLSLHTYAILLPVLRFLGITEASLLGFLMTRPTVAPTILVAAGGFGFSWARKRGFLNAWVRSSLALGEVKSLAAKYEIELAAKERTPNEIAREFLLLLQEAIRNERALWANQIKKDLESLNNPRKQDPRL